MVLTRISWDILYHLYPGLGVFSFCMNETKHSLIIASSFYQNSSYAEPGTDKHAKGGFGEGNKEAGKTYLLSGVDRATE